MKIVITGGTGQVGAILTSAFLAKGWDVVVLSRGGRSDARVVHWDGRTTGEWIREIDGSDAVINHAGRSVNCRYNAANLKAMMDSRVESAAAIEEAIQKALKPPRVWLQMSTATIYAHRFEAANDERSGLIGGTERDVPAYWSISIDIAKAWEKAQSEAATPATRKIALRTAMVMSPDHGGIFDMLLRLTRFGLGGSVGGGRQFVSWIHEFDFVRVVEFLITRDELSGPVNLCAPQPLPQTEFMAVLRKAWGMPIGLPATKWMAEIGAFFLRTDTELLFKSRRVVPGRLLEAGFQFRYPDWASAAAELVGRRLSSPAPSPDFQR